MVLQTFELEFLYVEEMIFLADKSTVFLIKFFQISFQGSETLLMGKVPDLTQRNFQFLPQ